MAHICERRTSELLAIDRLATCTVTLGEVATLEHELGDDTVESRPSVTETILACGKLTEVARRLGHNVVTELEDDAASGGATNGDIELYVQSALVEL